MLSLQELSAQYRISGKLCKKRMAELQEQLRSGSFSSNEEYELRRSITLLTAMSRECLATANYLRDYAERRQQLAKRREKTGA